MAEYQENYGQYSNRGEYSGLNIEDQTVAPPAASWGPGYNNPPQTSWTGDAAMPSNAQYGAPPVQPMYTGDPQYTQFQQGGSIFMSICNCDVSNLSGGSYRWFSCCHFPPINMPQLLRRI